MKYLIALGIFLFLDIILWFSCDRRTILISDFIFISTLCLIGCIFMMVGIFIIGSFIH